MSDRAQVWAAVFVLCIAGLVGLIVLPVPGEAFVAGLLALLAVGATALSQINAELNTPAEPKAVRQRSRRGFDGEQLAKRVNVEREFAVIAKANREWAPDAKRVALLSDLILVRDVRDLLAEIEVSS